MPERTPSRPIDAMPSRPIDAPRGIAALPLRTWILEDAASREARYNAYLLARLKALVAAHYPGSWPAGWAEGAGEVPAHLSIAAGLVLTAMPSTVRRFPGWSPRGYLQKRGTPLDLPARLVERNERLLQRMIWNGFVSGRGRE